MTPASTALRHRPRWSPQYSVPRNAAGSRQRAAAGSRWCTARPSRRRSARSASGRWTRSCSRCTSAGTGHSISWTTWFAAFPESPPWPWSAATTREGSEALLHLGASGVRQVIDVTGPEGWHRLRQVLGPAHHPRRRADQGPVLRAGRGAARCPAVLRGADPAGTGIATARDSWPNGSGCGALRSCRGSCGPGCRLPRAISRPCAWCTPRCCSSARATLWRTWRTGWTTPRRRASAATCGHCSGSPARSSGAVSLSNGAGAVHRADDRALSGGRGGGSGRWPEQEVAPRHRASDWSSLGLSGPACRS